MKVSNRTRRPIIVAGVTYPPSGAPIRLPESRLITLPSPIPAVLGPSYSPADIHITALEVEADDADIVIVSCVLLDAIERQADGMRDCPAGRALRKAAAPDTSKESAIRDTHGVLVGARRLVMHPFHKYAMPGHGG